MEDSNLRYQHIDPNELDQMKSSILKNKNFLSLWIGQTVSNIGSFFAFIAIIFFTLRLSSDMTPENQAQALALVTLIQVIPSVLLGPFSGVIVDRFDRKKIMVLMDLIGATTSLVIVFVSQLWQLYAIVSAYSVVRIFFYPAKQAAIPMIVDPENIMQANSLSQTTMQLSKIIGPALSGFVVAIYGLKMAFIIDAVSFILSAISIMMISISLKPAPSSEKLSPISALRDMKEGFSISWSNRVIRYIMLVMILFMIGASLIDPLFAFYLSTQFGLSEADFGLIISLSAVTGLGTAIIVSSKSNIDNKLMLISSTLLLAGISIAIIGLAPYFPYPMLALYGGMALIGSVNVLIMIPLSTLIQTIVSTENMGKVNGIMGSFISMTQVGGAALAGILVGFFSVSTIFTASGVFLSVIFVILFGLMKIYDLEVDSQEQQAKMIVVKREEHKNRNNETVEVTKQVLHTEESIVETTTTN